MFNSGFNNFYPYYTRPTGFFAGLKAKFDWGAILNNTQKTLNIVNQAIPIAYQVKPIINNAKTVFRVMGAVRDDDTKKEEVVDPIEEEEYYRGYPCYDDKPKKNGSKIAIVILVILIIAAVGAGVYVAKNGGFGNKEENTSQSAAVKQYEVPDFVSAGYTQSDIENNGAWNKQFKLTFVSKYSTDVEEGIVFEQSVESGKKVDEQTEIQLTVSKGVQTESVPNVAGQSLDDAKKTLEDKGFKVSTVEIYNDGSHEADTVKESYASAPAAGETVAVGEEIVLQVYGEVQTTTTVEPENDIGTD